MNKDRYNFKIDASPSMKNDKMRNSLIRKFAFDPSRDMIVSDLGIDQKHPYFEKKADKSVETLKRVGFPAELLKIQAKRIKNRS